MVGTVPSTLGATGCLTLIFLKAYLAILMCIYSVQKFPRYYGTGIFRTVFCLYEAVSQKRSASYLTLPCLRLPWNVVYETRRFLFMSLIILIPPTYTVSSLTYGFLRHLPLGLACRDFRYLQYQGILPRLGLPLPSSFPS